MQRADFYNYIAERLMTLSWRIESRGRLNILDYHLHSENFYRDFFNLLFEWELENLNDSKQNAEGIDLIDRNNKIIIQVSATATKAKIDASLDKPLLKDYDDYTFKFISIARSAENLKGKKYSIQDNLRFNPQDDIYDVDTVLKVINNLSIEKLTDVCEFIRKELGYSSESPKLKSDLTTIIVILAKENLSKIDAEYSLNSFDIERKIEFNNLEASRLLIEDYKIHYQTVDSIYSTYDKMGQNKSLAVLNVFRREYVDNFTNCNGDELYKIITNNIIGKIKDTHDFGNLSNEELILCVDILMVDAFIRCKIFENPNNYDYAFTR
jgi:hypothetical protein